LTVKTGGFGNAARAEGWIAFDGATVLIASGAIGEAAVHLVVRDNAAPVDRGLLGGESVLPVLNLIVHILCVERRFSGLDAGGEILLARFLSGSGQL
jgi:hypothetical protein